MSIQIKNYAVAALPIGKTELVPATAGRDKNIKSLSLSMVDGSGLYAYTGSDSAYEALASGVPSELVMNQTSGGGNDDYLHRGMFESFWLDSTTTLVIGSDVESFDQTDARQYAQILKVTAGTGEITPGKPLLIKAAGIAVSSAVFPGQGPWACNSHTQTNSGYSHAAYRLGNNVFFFTHDKSNTATIYRFSIGVDGSTLTYLGSSTVGTSAATGSGYGSHIEFRLANKKSTDTTVDGYAMLAGLNNTQGTCTVILVPLNSNGSIGTPVNKTVTGITWSSAAKMACARITPTGNVYVFGVHSASGAQWGFVTYDPDAQTFTTGATAQMSGGTTNYTYFAMWEANRDGNPGVIVRYNDNTNNVYNSLISTSSLSVSGTLNSSSYTYLASNYVRHISVYGSRHIFIHGANGSQKGYAITLTTGGSFSLSNHDGQSSFTSMGLIAGDRIYIYAQSQGGTFLPANHFATSAGLLYYSGSGVARYTTKPVKFGLPSFHRIAKLQNGAVAVLDGGYVHYYTSALVWTHSVSLENTPGGASMYGVMPHRIKPLWAWDGTDQGYAVGLGYNYVTTQSSGWYDFTSSSTSGYGVTAKLNAIAPNGAFNLGTFSFSTRHRYSASYGGFIGDFVMDALGNAAVHLLTYDGGSWRWYAAYRQATGDGYSAATTINTGISPIIGSNGVIWRSSVAIIGKTSTADQFHLAYIYNAGPAYVYRGVWSSVGNNFTSAAADNGVAGFPAYGQHCTATWYSGGKYYGVLSIGTNTRVYENGTLVTNLGVDFTSSGASTTIQRPAILPINGGGAVVTVGNALTNAAGSSTKTLALIGSSGLQKGSSTTIDIPAPYDFAFPAIGQPSATSPAAIVLFDNVSNYTDKKLAATNISSSSSYGVTVYLKKSSVSYPVSYTLMTAGDVISSSNEVALEDGAALEVESAAPYCVSAVAGVVEKF